MMTPQEKILHFHRRFGFGLAASERAELLSQPLRRVVESSLAAAKQDDFPVSPYQFCWRKTEKEEADVGAWRFRIWWTFRMVASKTPIREKLVLFWHSHFAVGDDKVEDGPMMLYYLQTLQKHAFGKFEDLLIAVSREPAMMRYLDMTRSVRGNPNENFAREVMELFTIGIGNYTEEDVREVARALTGWGYIHSYYELPGNADQKLEEALKHDRPFASFAYLPTWHDPSPKTILGQTKNWEGEDVLRMLARRPETATFVSRKLWNFYAGTEMPKSVEAKVVKTWSRTRGDISAVLREMMLADEFYSDAVVGKYTIHPADYVIGLSRKLNVGPYLLEKCATASRPTDQIPKVVLDQMGFAAYQMDRIGLGLLVPPDVSGWTWGEAFISSSAMAERFKFQGYYIEESPGKEHCSRTVFNWLKAQNIAKPTDVADKISEFYDAPILPEARTFIDAFFTGIGVPKAFEPSQESNWAGWHFGILRVITAQPSYHVI